MSNLQLSLKKKWFEMTKSGVKTEDYREITPYWFARFFKDGHKNKHLRKEACDNLSRPTSASKWNFDNGFYFKFKEFNNNIMTLGYPKSTDTDRILKLEHKGIEIGTGNPEWGAVEGKLYFVIKHGKILR